MAERLKLSAVQTRRLVAIAHPPIRVEAAWDARAARRALRQLGPDGFRDVVLTAWAGERSRGERGNTAGWTALLDAADVWRKPILPIRGQDVIDLGLPRGPAIGTLVAAVERWWEDDDYRPGRAECLARLRELAGKA